MNSLMHPAIAMMNRLSFGMKFSLISVLFFLPMLVTNYYLVEESYDTFIDTRNELNGLDVLSAGIKRTSACRTAQRIGAASLSKHHRSH